MNSLTPRRKPFSQPQPAAPELDALAELRLHNLETMHAELGARLAMLEGVVFSLRQQLASLERALTSAALLEGASRAPANALPASDDRTPLFQVGG